MPLPEKTELPEYLYLHVPFCCSICAYCDFAHVAYRSESADRWLTALRKEISLKKINSDLKTIYIGGGTPTSLSECQLETLLSMLDFCSRKTQEYTIEVNPETMTEQKAAILANHGINRASIGFESGDPGLLNLMNRHHTAKDTMHAMEMLRNAGITNISLDLMYSLPNQTMLQIQTSTMQALAMKPAHLSLYSLTIEPHTVFAAKHMKPCSEDLEADMYEWIARTLPEYGYQQYEISNFAELGKESVHNCAYWDYRDFYGISTGASGKQNGIRYDNTRDLNQYLENPLCQTKTILSRKDQMFEMIMMGMRLKQGMKKELFAERFGESVESVYGETIALLNEKGLIQKSEKYLAATEYGYEILNDILEEFLD